MYSVTVKGRTLEELKIAVNDINEELKNGTTVNNVQKNLEQSDVPTMELGPDEVEVPSLYSATPDEVEEAPVNGVELDSEGIPWDKRIHAGSKNKVKAGTWTTKRGVDKDLLAQVKAELLQQQHLAANPVAIPAAPINPATPAVAAPTLVAPVAEAPPVIAPVAAAPVAPVVEAPAAAVAPIAPPVAVPAGGHTLESFKANMPMVIGTLITEGKLTQDYVNSLKTHFGVTEIWSVTDAQKEEMFNTFVTHNIVVKVG